MSRIVRLVGLIGGVVLVLTACTSTAPDEAVDATSERRDSEPREYVEALPPPQKPTIAILPVENETGITDLDALSVALNETITLNLSLIGDYEIMAATEADAPAGQAAADYVVSGRIARGETGELAGRIDVVTRSSGQTDTIEEAVPSLLDIFATADTLSNRVMEFFVDESITVGTVSIVDERDDGGAYSVFIDGEFAGSTLRELTLLTGVRSIEIRRDDVPIFFRNVVVEADVSQRITINTQRYAGTPIALIVVGDFGFGGGPIARDVEAGFQQSVRNFSLDGTVYRPPSVAAAATLTRELVEDGVELVILPGWDAEEFLRVSGERYPDVTFLGIDVGFSDPGSVPANVRSVLVREDDAGYLAGIVAGSLTARHADILPQLNAEPTVGAVLGMRVPPVDRFFDGFTRGVRESDPNVKVVHRVTDTFGDRAAGRRAADDLIDEGVDIVFNIAGDTGIGVIEQAERRGVLAIGVDVDQSDIAPQTVVTSATKDYHAMTYIAIERWLAGELPADEAAFFLGIADGITPLAPFHEFEPYIPFAVRRRLDEAVYSIREG